MSRSLLLRHVRAWAWPSLAIAALSFGSSLAWAQGRPTPRADPASIHGEWRVSLGRRAPWLSAKDPVPDTTEWLRKRVVFAGKVVTGPQLLTCSDAAYETVDFPADALFQGGLPVPPERAARALGVRSFPVPSVELNCETGIFDFHLIDRETMLVAVNNVIWTLARATASPVPARK